MLKTQYRVRFKIKAIIHTWRLCVWAETFVISLTLLLPLLLWELLRVHRGIDMRAMIKAAVKANRTATAIW